MSSSFKIVASNRSRAGSESEKTALIRHAGIVEIVRKKLNKRSKNVALSGINVHYHELIGRTIKEAVLGDHVHNPLRREVGRDSHQLAVFFYHRDAATQQ